MGQIEDLQNKGFGSHGGKQYTVDHDITPLKKRVLVSDMHFGETRSAGGIILVDDDGSQAGIHPRWAKVYAIGKEQEDVKVGQWILVAHGRWSRAFKVKKDGVELEVRMIDENDILLLSDEEPEQNRKQAGYVNMGGAKQMTKLPGND
jgi:co-chaperonin GroES (HSP10)|tara:strand:+ start:33 stop:476 length:444 start_codon:yes stop_codon:yes gene_type:complete